jgi:two-component system, OmpR family, phosphate regulon response regulator PhoB
MSLPRVLLVDDELDLQKLVDFNLREAGFDVTAVGTGAAALAEAARLCPQVIVLDLMLPDIPGVEVCRKIRSNPALSGAAVLMLTARGDEYDRLLGFEVGADDYVVKPFSVRELVHRVRSLLRRYTPPTSAGEPEVELSWRGLCLDTSRHRVTADGVEVPLRPLEFRLLHLFLERGSEVLTRAELLEKAWGITADIQTRTVDTHIRRLREALGEYGDAIETVFGFGYRLREP